MVRIERLRYSLIPVLVLLFQVERSDGRLSAVGPSYPFVCDDDNDYEEGRDETLWGEYGLAATGLMNR